MWRIVVAAAGVGLATGPLLASQGGAPSNSLPRALRAFVAADVDGDGRIDPEEAGSFPVGGLGFAGGDLDGDGTWSRDEFLLYYRGQLVAGGQPVGTDLQREVCRIQALRRVRQVEETRRGSEKGDSPGPDVEPVAVRLRRALEDLERKDAVHQATREDFQRLRNLVILSGRAPDGASTAPPNPARALQTLETIEKRSAKGQFAESEHRALRAFALASDPIPDLPRPAPASRIGRARSDPTPEVPPTPSGSGPADLRRRAAGERADPKPSRTPAPPPTPRPGIDSKGTSRPSPPRS